MDNEPASIIAPEVISQKRIQKSEQARVEAPEEAPLLREELAQA